MAQLVGFILSVPLYYLFTLGSAVLTFIGFKQTNQSSQINKYIQINRYCGNYVNIKKKTPFFQFDPQNGFEKNTSLQIQIKNHSFKNKILKVKNEKKNNSVKNVIG